jgi:hypothetical protein
VVAQGMEMAQMAMTVSDIKPGMRVCLDGANVHDFEKSWRVLGVDARAVWIAGPGSDDRMAFAAPGDLVPYVGRPKLELVP